MKQESRYPLARAMLAKVRRADRKVELLRQRVANLRMLTTNTTVRLTGMPRSGSPDQQRLATLLAEIDEKERELQEAEMAALAIRHEAVKSINRISDPLLQQILRLHDLEGKSWKDIPDEIGYGRSRSFQYYDAGLAALDRILTEENFGLNRTESDCIGS